MINVALMKLAYGIGAAGIFFYLFGPLFLHPLQARMNFRLSIPHSLLLSIPLVLFWPATLVFLIFNYLDQVRDEEYECE